MADLKTNLIREMGKRGFAAVPLAEKAGLGRTAVTDILGGRVKNPRQDTLRKLADALSISVTELMTGEASEPVIERVTFSAKPDLPVYASAQGGDGGMVIVLDPIEFVNRPDYLSNVQDAFAFYVIGDSMEPRYEQGERLFVHPKRPARVGSDVLIITKDGDGLEHAAMVKRLVSVSRDVVRVRQYNPPQEFDIDRSTIANMFKIMGSQTSD